VSTSPTAVPANVLNARLDVPDKVLLQSVTCHDNFVLSAPVVYSVYPIPLIFENGPSTFRTISFVLSAFAATKLMLTSIIARATAEEANAPIGIIFNPVSIEKLIHRAINKIEFVENDIFFHNERWHCYEVHSDCSNTNKDEFLENLNSSLKTSIAQLFQASHIIITYGTSWVYRNKETNEIVANCHKIPQKEFSKEILSIETIEKSIQNTINLIRKINPSVNFIFTVSPVRHLKDGFVENQLSKAHLITAIYQILEPEICNLKSAIYFPSYEIMMDELRDYRFYAEDMIHPNQVAIDYIWERFAETSISAKQTGTSSISSTDNPFSSNDALIISFCFIFCLIASITAKVSDADGRLGILVIQNNDKAG
jgi:hypothetical protein